MALTREVLPHSTAKTVWDLGLDLITLFEQEPLRAYQGVWVRDVSERSPYSMPGEQKLRPACGTVGCKAGWLAILTRPRKQKRIDFGKLDDKAFDIVRELLGGAKSQDQDSHFEPANINFVLPDGSEIFDDGTAPRHVSMIRDGRAWRVATTQERGKGLTTSRKNPFYKVLRNQNRLTAGYSLWSVAHLTPGTKAYAKRLIKRWRYFMKVNEKALKALRVPGR